MKKSGTKILFPSMPVVVFDFLTSKTARRMSTEEIGAYWLLLMEAWVSDPPCFLENNSEFLRNTCKISSYKWPKIKKNLLKNFKEKDGYLYNERQCKEYQICLEAYRKKRLRSSKGGKAKAAKRKDSGGGNGCLSTSQEDYKQCLRIASSARFQHQLHQQVDVKEKEKESSGPPDGGRFALEKIDHEKSLKKSIKEGGCSMDLTPEEREKLEAFLDDPENRCKFEAWFDSKYPNLSNYFRDEGLESTLIVNLLREFIDAQKEGG